MTGVRATPHAVNRKLADYDHWEEAERGIRIYVHAGMADRLQATILQGAADEREVGGILLGRAADEQGKTVAFIDDFVEVPCSYGGDGHYELIGEDIVNLEAALLRTAFAGCESPVAPSSIGYYRSHIREGLSMSAADLELAGSYFQTPGSVFLIIKTIASTKALTAGFFFREDGQIQSEFSSLEVALGHTQPEAGAQSSEAGGVPGLPDEITDDLSDDLPADLPELSGPPADREAEAPGQTAPAAAPRGWQELLIRAATILIATAALIISVVTYLSGPKSPREEAAAAKPALSALGLQVDRNPPDLLVSWNKSAREIVAARRATLFIQDGKAERMENLDSTQLAGGSYLYTAASDEIQVRLEVYGTDGGSVAQSVRVRAGAPHR